MPEGSRPTETPTPARLEELDREIASAVERAVRALHSRISERLRQGSEELLRLVTELKPELPASFLAGTDLARRLAGGDARRARAVDHLFEAVVRLDGERTQSGLLLALLEEARRFASRAAFLLTRPDGVHGWAGQGFGAAGQALAELKLGYDEGSPQAALATGEGVVELNAGDCARFTEAIGASPAEEGLLIPFVLRGQLGGALYADRLEGDEPLARTSLQLLTHAASQALETLALRGEGGSPTLRLARRAAAGGERALWAADTAAAAAPATTEEAPPAEEPAPAAEEAVAEEAVAEETAAAEEAVAEETAAAEEAVAEEVFGEETAATAAAAEAAAPAEAAASPEPGEIDSFELEPAASFEEDMAALDRPVEEAAPAEDEDLWAAEEEPAEAVPAASEEATVPAAEAPAAGQPTVRLDLKNMQEAPAAAETPGWELGETVAETPADEPLTAAVETPSFELDTSTQEVGTVSPPPEVDLSEDPTLMSSMPSLVTPPAAPPPESEQETAEMETPVPAAAAEEEEAAPAAAAKSTSEVMPPEDVQGPGSAFAGEAVAVADDEAALHEEARRLARLLVSEIKLYNEEVIEEGRREGNIYGRLKDDIDRSRQMYDERIDPRLRGGEDYFYQELVQRLAGGDAKVLGL
ncbi:MAG: hypothetical protein D6696_18025 [Acidobacteria bacterium]|nr:MAG: hypothetical protein D6696_18025 [Acidobacteriota bacterium]